MLIAGLASIPAWAAYHHQGEQDAAVFLSVYPDKAGTKIDHCALCHKGGEGPRSTLGSCQWCHYSYGYHPPHGDIDDTLNQYGLDYRTYGQNSAAIVQIETLNSDEDANDTYTNIEEINAVTYPGNSSDYPGLTVAPYRIYTRAQVEAMTVHTQFMLMNTSRSGDEYAEYTGVPMKELLDDAGILGTATNIIVYSVDGWSQTHPLEYVDPAVDEEAYHVYGNMPGENYQYPPAAYHYDEEADVATSPDCGWCEYDAPSCAGRTNGDPIFVENGGMKAILAHRRDGVYLDPGVLNDSNKLDGEGPFRLVVPQKIDLPPPPDQSSRAQGDCVDVLWPYNEMGGDHNAGACSKSATIIKVEPLPPGMTDIDILEAGWSYVDNNKVIIYGAIDGTDSNDNGVLDSEEGTNDPDPTKARVREAYGGELIQMQTAAGEFKNVACLLDDDPAVPQANKPATIECPFGAVRFEIVNLIVGETVDVTLTFPGNVPTNAKYYKIHPVRGWVEIPFGSNDGDNTIVLTLTDGDADLDADGQADGKIVDPGAVTVASTTAPSSSASGCFIATAAFGSAYGPKVMILKEFRDHYLLDSAAGRALVSAYYKYSPPFAAAIADREGLKKMTRISLLPIVLFADTVLQYGFFAALASTLAIFTLCGGLGWYVLRGRRRSH